MDEIHHREDPYEILEIAAGATEAEIKQAYFAKVRRHPPESDPEGFKRIRAAYEILRSAQQRAELDLFQFDRRVAALDPSQLARPEVEAPKISTATIKEDLLAIEALFLFEDVASDIFRTER